MQFLFSFSLGSGGGGGGSVLIMQAVGLEIRMIYTENNTDVKAMYGHCQLYAA